MKIAGPNIRAFSTQQSQTLIVMEIALWVSRESRKGACAQVVHLFSIEYTPFKWNSNGKSKSASFMKIVKKDPWVAFFMPNKNFWNQLMCVKASISLTKLTVSIVSQIRL